MLVDTTISSSKANTFGSRSGPMIRSRSRWNVASAECRPNFTLVEVGPRNWNAVTGRLSQCRGTYQYLLLKSNVDIYFASLSLSNIESTLGSGDASFSLTAFLIDAKSILSGRFLHEYLLVNSRRIRWFDYILINILSTSVLIIDCIAWFGGWYLCFVRVDLFSLPTCSRRLVRPGTLWTVSSSRNILKVTRGQLSQW